MLRKVSSDHHGLIRIGPQQPLDHPVVEPDDRDDGQKAQQPEGDEAQRHRDADPQDGPPAGADHPAEVTCVDGTPCRRTLDVVDDQGDDVEQPQREGHPDEVHPVVQHGRAPERCLLLGFDVGDVVVGVGRHGKRSAEDGGGAALSERSGASSCRSGQWRRFQGQSAARSARQGEQWFLAARVMDEMLAFNRRVETFFPSKAPVSV